MEADADMTVQDQEDKGTVTAKSSSKDKKKPDRDNAKGTALHNNVHDGDKGSRCTAPQSDKKRIKVRDDRNQATGSEDSMEMQIQLTMKGMSDLHIGNLEPGMLVVTALDEEVLSHLAILDAEEMLGLDTMRLQANRSISSIEDAQRWMAAVGFRFAATDHWIKIALNQDACAGLPIFAMQRVSQANRLLTLCAKMLPDAQQTFQEWLYEVKMAAEACERGPKRTQPREVARISMVPQLEESSARRPSRSLSM